MRKRLAILTILCLSLTCCSQPEISSCNQPDWQTQQQSIMQNRQWIARGSAVLNRHGNYHVGYFTWEQQGQAFTIDIAGPMHIPVATIEGNTHTSHITTADGKKPTTFSHWMKQQLGYPLSILTLSQVIQGMPQTDTIKYRNHYPHIATYDHFTVTWQRYGCYAIGYRPQKVFIQLDNNQTLTLLIHEWYKNAL